MCKDDLDRLLTGGMDTVIRAGCMSLGLLAGIGIIWTILLIIL